MEVVCAPSVDAQLELAQGRVGTGMEEELGVGPGFHDPPAFQDDDAIRETDRPQTVGDGQRGPTSGRDLERG
jgi:hypothetical protein